MDEDYGAATAGPVRRRSLNHATVAAGDDKAVRRGSLSKNDKKSVMSQNTLLCPNVVANGQLRKLYEISVDNSPSNPPLDVTKLRESSSGLLGNDFSHNVQLCFLQSGMYTVYALAREINIVKSAEGSKIVGSSWWLDPSPVLVSTVLNG